MIAMARAHVLRGQESGSLAQAGVASRSSPIARLSANAGHAARSCRACRPFRSSATAPADPGRRDRRVAEAIALRGLAEARKRPCELRQPDGPRSPISSASADGSDSVASQALALARPNLAGVGDRNRLERACRLTRGPVLSQPPGCEVSVVHGRRLRSLAWRLGSLRRRLVLLCAASARSLGRT
jgi:hypothetical protein